VSYNLGLEGKTKCLSRNTVFAYIKTANIWVSDNNPTLTF